MPNVNNERARKVVEYYFTHQPTTWGAAMRANGYSKSVAGRPTFWKNKPMVQALIKAYERTLAGGGGIEPAQLEGQLQEIALGPKVDYIQVQKDGSLRPDYTNMTDQDKKLIKEIQVDETKRANGTTQIKTRVIYHDKLAAIRMLMMAKGMFKDQVEVKGEVSLIERLQRGRQVVCDLPRGYEVDREKMANGDDIH